MSGGQSSGVSTPTIQVIPKRSVSMPYSGANGAGASGMRTAWASSDNAFHRVVISSGSVPYSVM